MVLARLLRILSLALRFGLPLEKGFIVYSLPTKNYNYKPQFMSRCLVTIIVNIYQVKCKRDVHIIQVEDLSFIIQNPEV